MTIETRTFDYFDGDTRLEAYVARDSNERTAQPVVLVAHAWGGRAAFECQKAEALAALGYVGFALDMYGEGAASSDPAKNQQRMQVFLDDRPKLQRRMALAVEAARSLDGVDGERIAAIGYCFGGLCVLDLARSGSDVRGVVSFHGLVGPPGNTAGRSISAKVLVLNGAKDPWVPRQQLVALEDELNAASADWQILNYGGAYHAFTNPGANTPGSALFDADADRRSWATMRGFLGEVLG